GRWRLDRDARFGLAWAAAMVALLSCARFKRSDYLLPAYPGLALFLGCAAESWLRERSAAARRWAVRGFAATLAACGLAWLAFWQFVLPGQDAANRQAEFAARVRASLPPGQVVLFFRAESHALAFHLGRPLNTFLEW